MMLMIIKIPRFLMSCLKVEAFVTEAMPGAFAWLGIRNETAGSTSGVHTAQFVMDEAVLPIGASLHAAVALDFFAQHAGGARDTGGKVEL